MKSVFHLLSLSYVLVISTQVQAAGLEKSTLWSGRYMSIGGAAASSVQGAEALYFNPAGLGSSKMDKDLTLNLSPTFIESSGPNVTVGTNETSKRVAFPNSLIYAQKLNEKISVGVGTYTGGGSDIQYSDITAVAGRAAFANIRTIVAIQEISAGLSYQLTEKLKVGAAWRGAFVTADMSSLTVADINPGTAGSEAINVELRNMTGSNMYGYRLGVQYTEEDWAAGIMYRSNLDVLANGRAGGHFNSSAGTFAIDGSNMSVATSFPQALSLGGHLKLSDDFTAFTEFTWTQYGLNEKLDFEGTYSIPIASTVSTSAIPDQRLNWMDQYNARLGAQYTGWGMPVRAGYVYTSQVTPEHRATTTLAPPGAGHTLSVGTGMKLMNDQLSIDGALERTMITGTVAPGIATARQGTYEATVNVVHLGATYGF
jgi:long-subunit fatty acid transport protein